jgi:septal ring factor EnvC (AmiA/AmiB activator)
MTKKHQIAGLILAFSALALCQCGKKTEVNPHSSFTKADSVMDSYLWLQDSIHDVWNVMINDDNKKIAAMRHLLHELEVSSASEPEIIKSYEQRLDQLVTTRYNQKSMANADVIEEYDFASNSMVTELVSLAESRSEFAYNTTLQKLVDEILAADQRVNNYRDQYDLIAEEFNSFLEKNKTYLKEIEEGQSLDKKPLFQMASDSQ